MLFRRPGEPRCRRGARGLVGIVTPLLVAGALITVSAPPADAATVTVSGQVTDGTSGLDRVCVYVETSDFSTVFSGETNNVGAYVVSGITPGDSYVVQFDPACFGTASSPDAGAYYDGVAGGTPSVADATLFPFATSQSGLNIALGTGSTAGGTVHTDTGSAANDVCVSLDDETDGWSYEAQSDSSGTWSATGVAYGNYTAFFDPTCAASQPTSPDAPQFWGGAVDYADADTFSVAGPTTSFSPVTLAKGGVISGTVTQPNGAPAANVCVGVFSAGPEYLYDYLERTGASGQYQFDSLAATSYSLYYDPGCEGTLNTDYAQTYANGTQTSTPIPVAVGGVAAVSGNLVFSGTAPAIAPSAAANATVGAAYSQSFSTTAGVAPFTWSASGLPAGLSINASTGLVSGTPSASGSSPATIVATDSSAQAVVISGSVNFVVNAAPAPVTTTTTAPPSTTSTTTTVPPPPVHTAPPAPTPKATIGTTELAMTKRWTAPVAVSCATAVCTGTIRLVQEKTARVPYRVKQGKKTVTRYRNKTTITVLGTVSFKLAKGKKATETLLVNSVGRRLLAGASGKRPLREDLETTIRGAKTATKPILVS